MDHVGLVDGNGALVLPEHQVWTMGGHSSRTAPPPLILPHQEASGKVAIWGEGTCGGGQTELNVHIYIHIYIYLYTYTHA